MLLAIETSCDETAAAIIDVDAVKSGSTLADSLRADIISSQIKVHQPYGGVVPELAAREHITNLPTVVGQAYKDAGIAVDDIQYVAVTRGPGLKGCLLVGLCFAKALSFSRKVPLLALNHLEGHILAADLADEVAAADYPALALIVSGGHTTLILVESFRQYRILANTRDDAAGEAFDKSATLLGLPYPGGPALSKAAEQGDENAYPLPRAMRDDPESFSFSGLKTAVWKTVTALGTEIEDPLVVANVAASVEHAIVDSLVEKVAQACDYYQPKSLILTGGVAANRVLRERLSELATKKDLRYRVPPHRWCTDNAAMIGALGTRILQNEGNRYKNWTPTRGMLGPDVADSISAVPRWPLGELSRETGRG